VRRAVELGVTFFDTADMYSLGASEEVTGELLAELFAHREDYVLATKVFMPMGEGRNDRGLSRKHILASIDNSLRRLGTDHVDLYQIHRWDPHTPIEETLETLHDLVRAGKVRYLGASSMYAWQFAQALYLADLHGWTRFVSMQNHYNLLNREEEREMIPLCLDQGIGVIPWSPLARGRLTRDRDEQTERSADDPFGRSLYRRTEEADRVVSERVAEVAAKRGVPRAQVALAWVAGSPGVTAPIVGATKPHHLNDAIASVDIELTPDEICALEQPYTPQRVTSLV
jgi:aryl-alcohol dehydrogenase (NADP+)